MFDDVWSAALCVWMCLTPSGCPTVALRDAWEKKKNKNTFCVKLVSRIFHNFPHFMLINYNFIFVSISICIYITILLIFLLNAIFIYLFAFFFIIILFYSSFFFWLSASACSKFLSSWRKLNCKLKCARFTRFDNRQQTKSTWTAFELRTL